MSKMKKQELELCPFCGQEANIDFSKRIKHIVKAMATMESSAQRLVYHAIAAAGKATEEEIAQLVDFAFDETEL